MSSMSGTASTGCDSTAERELAEVEGEAAQAQASPGCLSSATVLLANPDHGFKREAAFLDPQTKVLLVGKHSQCLGMPGLWGQLLVSLSTELMGLQCLATTEVSSAQGEGLSPRSSFVCRMVLTQLVSGGKHTLAGYAGTGYFLGACLRSGASTCGVRFPLSQLSWLWERCLAVH